MAAQRNNRISNAVIQQQYATHGKAWCEYCGIEVFLHVPITAYNRCIGDHRIPMSRGGDNVHANIAISCHACDRAKGPLTKEEYLTVADNTIERRRLINQVLFDLGRVPRIYEYNASMALYNEQRKLARRQSLQNRLKSPEPNCEYCEGTGKIHKSSTTFHYCRCSIKPLSA